MNKLVGLLIVAKLSADDMNSRRVVLISRYGKADI